MKHGDYRQCLLCGSRKKSFLLMDRDRLHAIPGHFRVVKCTQCKLVQLDPQPTAKELKKYYVSDYYAYAPYNPNTKQEKFAVKMYKLFFGNGNPIMKLIFLPFKHLLRGTKIIPGGKILDVGCGNGSFLYKMQSAGMDAYGVEISKEGCAQAKKLGIKVKCGTLEDQKYPSHFFDVITLSHVFEHVQNPNKTMRELKRILKPNGQIIITVPNHSSFARWYFGRYWACRETPRHMFLPSPKTMRQFAKKADLKVKKIRYTSFPASFHVSAMFSLYKNRQIPLDQKWMNNSRLLYWLCFPFVYIVDFLRIGDVIEATLTNA